MSEPSRAQADNEGSDKARRTLREEIFSYVPFTPLFWRQHKKESEKRFRRYDGRSEALNKLEDWHEKWKVEPKLQELWQKTASVGAYEDVLGPTFITLVLVIAIGLILVAPAVSVSIIGTSSARGWLWTWGLHLASAVLVYAVFFGVPLAIPRVVSNRSLTAWYLVISIGWVAIATWAIQMPVSELRTSPRLELATGVSAGLVGCWATLVISITFAVILSVRRRKIELSMPDVVAVSALLQLFDWHDSYIMPDDLYWKGRWVDQLEKAARSLERDIPRMLGTGDIATDRWVRAGCAGMATAIRDLKKSVIAPSAETHQSLSKDLAEIVRNVGSGTWEKVPSRDPEPIARRSLPLRLLGILRTLAVAALPGFVLWVLQLTPLALEGKAADWATVAALIWALVSLLIRADPLLRDKLDTIDRVLTIARGGEKKQEP